MKRRLFARLPDRAPVPLRPPGHVAGAFARVRASRRATIGGIVLAWLALLALFAEFLASPAPLLAASSRGVALLPALAHPGEYARLPPSEVEARHAGSFAVWPLVRAGPETPVDAGPLAASSLAHPLGTDAAGRDLFARLVYGARSALGLSLLAVSLGMGLGVLLGGLASHLGGVYDSALARVVETVYTFPAIVVVALVRAALHEAGAIALVLAVAFVRWAETARLVRAEVIRAESEGYVTAARALGLSRARVFVRHILPNAEAPVAVSSVFGLASVVLLESSLSFLGMGVREGAASWGETIAEGARHLDHPRLVVLPCLLLAAAVGGFYLVAEALRDAADPKTLRKHPDARDDSPLSIFSSTRLR